VPAGPGRIDVVATPIGNLADLSPRARETLANADLIAAEDTRHTGAMLRQLGIDRPLISLHEHNEAQRVAEVLAKLANGARIALVSDAGTPLVSDPGYLLVRAAIDAGYPVHAVPGPSAVMAALAMSGLASDRFCFEGFLPAKEAARRERLRCLAREPRTQVYFEAPHRVIETLETMAEVFGAERRAAVAREISKAFESVYRGSLAQLLEIGRKEANFARGEITLVVAGLTGVAAAPDDAFVARALELLNTELPPSRAAALVAQLTGRRKADVYALTRNKGPIEEELMTELPLKLISSMATRELLATLTAQYEANTSRRAVAEAAGGVEVARRVQAGESVDVVVLSDTAIDKLIAEGKVQRDRVDLVRSGVAIAVRAGAARPDIATEEAVKRAVTGAQTLSYSTGPSGVYLEKLFERWGILEQIRSRIVVPPSGVPVGSLVASGAAELGFQQLSELMNLPGIDVVGALPPEIQTLTIFSGAVAANSKAPDAARELLRFLASPDVAQIKRQHGMEPCLSRD
jgi:16S rRNA (cytidine1402-2'-O)-methyltransferase